MDDKWERSIPFYEVSYNEIDKIFDEYVPGIQIKMFCPINTGSRNSNYCIDTNKGKYLLRVCPIGETGYHKEKLICDAMRGAVRVPELLYISENNVTDRVCLIYEFIDAVCLQTAFANGRMLNKNMIRQVAENAAFIHNYNKFNPRDFGSLEDYPPYITWYDLFMNSDIAEMRMGKNLISRVKKLIAENSSEMTEIDYFRGFIHSDFRPANMLIDKNDDIYIVDWEYAGFGHILADIGQFFRYHSFFNPELMQYFEECYNKSSNRKLPLDWVALCKILDLVNPLQMLGIDVEQPYKNKDLIEIIIGTLNYFGY